MRKVRSGNLDLADLDLTEIPAGERLIGEPDGAWAAFQHYRDLRDARSHMRLIRELRISQRLVAQWSKLYQWKERCEAWDELQAQGRGYASRLADISKEAASWDARQALTLEDAYQVGVQVLNRGKQMLAHPLTEKVIEKRLPPCECGREGQPCKITIKPVGWTYNSVPKVIESAIQIMQSAIDLGQQFDKLNTFDVDQATPEECQAIVTEYRKRRDNLLAEGKAERGGDEA